MLNKSRWNVMDDRKKRWESWVWWLHGWQWQCIQTKPKGYGEEDANFRIKTQDQICNKWDPDGEQSTSCQNNKAAHLLPGAKMARWSSVVKCPVLNTIAVISLLFLVPASTKPQAKNCKWGVVSEIAHSQAQKLLSNDGVSERCFVSPHKWDWQFWKRYCFFKGSSVILMIILQSSEMNSIASSFYGDRDEMMCGGKVVVLCDFVGCRLVHCKSCTPRRFTNVKRGMVSGTVTSQERSFLCFQRRQLH